jgi:hypothetical protein
MERGTYRRGIEVRVNPEKEIQAARAAGQTISIG